MTGCDFNIIGRWKDAKQDEGGINDAVDTKSTYMAVDTKSAYMKKEPKAEPDDEQRTELVDVAYSQIGNVGGEPYWSWFGCTERVAWCACFVSWCANEVGLINAGIIPKFSRCSIGAQWFKENSGWQGNSYTPSVGDIIFFDWDNRDGSGPQDGSADHVGIVKKVKNGNIYTIEGNMGDRCVERCYAVGYYEIFGFGVPAYE